jgi:hypothetical protein
MIHRQDDEAARKWEEFHNQPTGGPCNKRDGCVKVVRGRGGEEI